MKQLLLLVLLLTTGALTAQSGVLIAPESGTPDTDAVLELRSSTQGFLPPRLRELQRDAIPTPPDGLVIYNTNTNRLNVYDAAADEWTELATVPSTPPTQTITVSSAAFTSVDSQEESFKTQGQGGAYLLPAPGSGTLVADLQIPSGSRITNVIFYYRDRTSSAEISMRLGREFMTSGFFGSIATEATGVVNASPDWTSVSTDVDHVVSASAGYYISAFSTNWSSDLSIKGASVTYVPPSN